MAITIGELEISCAYLGNTPFAEIYAGETKVRPVKVERFIDFLLIGWGGMGGNATTSRWRPAWWGGAWGFVECFWYEISAPWTYTVTIGCWGQDWGNSPLYGRGCPSCFDTVIAYWGWMWLYNAGMDASLRNGASGGWWSCWVAWGCALYWNQWCKGAWNMGSYCGAWWGWAWATPSWSWYCPMKWGDGKCSSMSWEEQRYSWGWWGASGNANNIAAWGAWGWGNGGTCRYAPTSATYYWGWGWGAGLCGWTIWWSWCQWVFILRYPSSCWYNITWWTKYLCNWYCIHCFTSSWTLTIS